MNQPDTTEFVQFPQLAQLLELGERFPINSLELWMLIFSLISGVSVLYCIFMAASRMLHSKVKALRVKCWFVVTLTIGQGMVAHATFTRAFNGVWEEYYLMAGLSLWLGGRMSITIYDKINKYLKDRRVKC